MLGSSLAVMSSYKIALDFIRADKPIAVVNQFDEQMPRLTTCGELVWRMLSMF